MAYIKKRPENYHKPTFDELLKEYTELTSKYKRQHGRKLVLSKDPKKAYKQIYNALASIKSRNHRKEYDARTEKSYVELYGFGADDADANGIRPVDRRRYTAKFKNCPKGAVVELNYLMMMTGLTLKQVYLLQEETGLKPYPAVTEKVANRDQAIRDREAIYL